MKLNRDILELLLKYAFRQLLHMGPRGVLAAAAAAVAARSHAGYIDPSAFRSDEPPGAEAVEGASLYAAHGISGHGH